MSTHSMVPTMPRAFGVQLYTVRSLLHADAVRTLTSIYAMGFTEIELHCPDIEQFLPLVRGAGLNVVSTHVPTTFLTGDQPPPWNAPANANADNASNDRLLRQFERIRAGGLTHVVLAQLLPDERGRDKSSWLRFGDWMNEIGRLASRTQLALAYHNHAFEFAPHRDGFRPFDVLVDTFDPALVYFELDVFWSQMAGVDPAGLVRSLGSRVALLHLKDKAAHASLETDEQMVPSSAFVEVGSGDLDMPAILRAAEAVGVHHVFVEQDHTPGDPLDSLERSAKYLQTLAQCREGER
jgi:sugar phosphate isomerase/epimerase